MFAEFEERQFEAALNAELVDPVYYVFVPGQVFEGTLGIDAAFPSKHPLFWKWHRRFPYYPFPTGARLEGELWEIAEDELRRFPPLCCNVFLQHKRPEYLMRSNSSQWSFWNGPYYRFGTMTHQQATLARLEVAIGATGVVSYASPAFYKFSTLWTHMQNRELVENFNFAAPSRLASHSVYTYGAAGVHGRANPEPEDIESVHPRHRIEEVVPTEIEPIDFILGTAETIRRVVSNDHGVLRQTFDIILEATGQLERPRIARAFDVIAAFCYVYTVSWSLARARG